MFFFNKHNHIYILISSFFLIYSTLYAQNVEVKYPKEVAVGDQFYIHYQITDTEVPEFDPPMFDGFIYLNSSRSSSSQISVINGKTTSSHSLAVSISLEATREGNFTISGGTVKHHGRVVATVKPITIYVVKGNHSRSDSHSSNRYNNDLDNENDDDVFIVVSTSKDEVYVQEPLVVTYSIYYRVGLEDLKGTLPTLNNFYAVDMDVPQTMNRINHKGHTYNVALWKKTLLYPLKAGMYEIPSFECEVFYYGFQRSKKIKTQAKSINVKSLPSPPTDYSEALGTFDLSKPILNKKHLSSGDVLSLKINIAGTGNFHFFEKPAVSFPNEFEEYKSRSTEDLDLTENGYDGTKTFEFLAVPRKRGSYIIPPIHFTYFDIESKTYKTLSTDSITITADKSVELDNSPTPQPQNLSGLAAIKTGTVDMRSDHYSMLYSWKWMLLYLMPILLLFIYIYFRQYYNSLSSEDSANKQKNAFKIAFKELQFAKSSSSSSFYEQLLRLLYNYVGNKFLLKPESMNKAMISTTLHEHGVNKAKVGELIQLLEYCEISKYTPATNQASLQTVYEKTQDLLSEIEKTCK